MVTVVVARFSISDLLMIWSYYVIRKGNELSLSLSAAVESSDASALRRGYF